jgi:hemerythrin superfamily protein
MDVVDAIQKDHRKVEELFSRYKGGGGLTGLVKRVTGTVTPRERGTAVQRICKELEQHTKLEEQLVYPAARATGDSEITKLVDESLRGDARVKELVRDLDSHRYEGEELDSRMSELEECVTHHVREQEYEMLPRFEQLVPEARRAELGRRFKAAKRPPTGSTAGTASARRTATRRPVAARTGPRRRTTGTKATSRKRARARPRARK